MKNKFFFVAIFSLVFTSSLLCAQEKKEDVRYEYKKYEKVDLGNLEIKGNIIAPGDLSVNERANKVFSEPLPERKNYDPEIEKDVLHNR